MKNEFVFAVYDRIEDANAAVEQLIGAGVPASAISLYANDDVVDNTHRQATIEIEELDKQQESEPSIWQRITNLFSSDKDFAGEGVDLSTYKDEIDDGSIIVAVLSEFEANTLQVNKQAGGLSVDNENRYESNLRQEEDFTADSAVAEPVPQIRVEDDESELHVADQEAEPLTGSVVAEPVPDVNEGDATLDLHVADRGATAAGDAATAEPVPNINVEDDPDNMNDTSSDYEPEHIDVDNTEPEVVVDKDTQPNETERLLEEENVDMDSDEVTTSSHYSDATDTINVNPDTGLVEPDPSAAGKTEEINLEGDPIELAPDSQHPIVKGDEDYYTEGERARQNRPSEGTGFQGVTDMKRPVTKSGTKKGRLNKIEEEMNYRRDAPPSDEPGVNN